MIDKSLDDVIDSMKDHNLANESVQKLLAVMEYGVPYTATSLMDKLSLKSRDGFRRNYLQKAIELKLIKMESPDKPKSRNQRYIKN